MNLQSKWICPAEDMGEICPIFTKNFGAAKPLKSATLLITAIGVYEAEINGARVGNFVLAPGWTSYANRLQYQEYDVTNMIKGENAIAVTVGKGWYRSDMPGWVKHQSLIDMQNSPAGIFAQITLEYTDGSTETVISDSSWSVSPSRVRFSEIYDGEIYDATVTYEPRQVREFDGPTATLIPQQGEIICEQERIRPATIFTTPKGEIVVDFGQNLTGYVEINLTASAGDEVSLSFAEVMDKEGNFYTENYRRAKAQYSYTCKDGTQTWKPSLTFYGFRYARINKFPSSPEKATKDNFTAIAVNSDIERTGRIRCSNATINRLIENVIWGQKGNFVDVPTDCPQRDERLGWTGDAQAFIKTACLNFDVEKFFTKWLTDLKCDQKENGRVGHVIPDYLPDDGGSAAWGDAATICPWEIYMAYGNVDILRQQFDSMKKWVDFITGSTAKPNLWIGGKHFGDWLGLDAPSGSYKGASSEDFIASAFYAHSTSLVIKAGKVLGEDVSEYEALYEAIIQSFREEFPVYKTQTECVLAVHFNLAPDTAKAADQLASLVKDAGIKLETGFVGTPYLMHVLSSYGYAELAYSLLLRDTYPSWLYPITKGATTIWEHWDGIMEDGSFWSADMNSYNHYAYGAVADWLYTVSAGINPVADAPGYKRVYIAPVPDARLDWLEADYKSRYGSIHSVWRKQDGFWRYEIETPVDAEICIAGEIYNVSPGSYVYFSPVK